MIEFGAQDRTLEVTADRGRFRVDQVDRYRGQQLTLNAANAADLLRRGQRVTIPADVKLLWQLQSFLASSGHIIR